MNLEARKIEFIQEFLKLQSDEVITLLENILQKSKTTTNHTFSPMSIDEFNKRIDASLTDSLTDNVISATDLKAEIDQWN